MTDKYLNDHALDGHMKIKQTWASPIAELSLNLPDDIRMALIKFVASSGYGTTMGTHEKTQTPEFEELQYNLFNWSDENPLIAEFEVIASEMIRYYIANAYDIRNANDLDIEARCFGNMQKKGRRTYPHYHHSFDFVMIHYLSCGGEFDIKNMGEPNEEFMVIPPNSEVEVMKPKVVGHGEGQFQISDKPLPCEGSGAMIMTDPRPAINFPYNQKAHSFLPKNGMTIFHPAYIWHSSNTFEGEGIRCAVVINARILTKNNSQLVSRLSKI